MKKLLSLFFVLLLSSQSAFAATDSEQLQQKLNKYSQLNGQFIQTVTNSEGKVLNESEGQYIISRPGKFHWQITSPEEELIVSDGKTMWYYSPMIEQVTLININETIEGTPFALLAGADDNQWLQFSVEKQGNNFTVKRADQKVQDTSFVFEFDGADNITQFVVIEHQGQRSEFKLKQQALQKLTDATFTFAIPEGVEVDDQR